MSGTFTLTGRLKMHDRVTPLVDSKIVVAASPYPDLADATVYSGGSGGVTDANGEFSMPLLTEPSLYYQVSSVDGHFVTTIFAAPADGTTKDITALVTFDPSTLTPTILTQVIAARDAAIAAAGVWTALTVYVAGQSVQAPDGSRIKRIANGTSRATFDSTEQALWTTVSTTPGTLEQVALGNAYPAKPLAGDGSILVAPRSGNNSNDGLSWGKAKATLTGAIAALPAGGGTILVAGGATTETNVVIDRSNVTVLAIGHGGATVNCAGVNKANGIIAIGRDNIHLRNLTIIGSGQGAQPTNTLTTPAVSDLANSGSGIILAGCSNSTVIGCTLDSHGGTTGVGNFNGVAAIWLTYGCTNCTIEQNTVTNSRNAINEDNFFAANPHGNKIVHNRIDSCRFGIALDSESATTGSLATVSVGYAVQYDTLVEGNTVTNCLQSGIDLNKARRTRVAENYVETCGTESGNSGIVAYGSASNYASDITITGNQVYNCGKAGTGGHGIKASIFAYDITITDNTCAGNVFHGILAQGAVRYNTVTGNRCVENGQKGIYFDGSVGGGNVSTNTIERNTVRANGQDGIYCYGLIAGIVANNTIRGNGTATANTYDAIRFTGGSQRNTVTGNITSGSAHRYSISFGDSTSYKNTVEGNDFGDPWSGSGTDYTTDRIGIASGAEVQYWGVNGDNVKPTSGAPTGNWPTGTRVYSTADGTTYLKTATGWVNLAATLTSRERLSILGQGLRGEPFSRLVAGGSYAATAGECRVVAVGMHAGEIVTGIAVHQTVAGSGVTLAKGGVWSSAGAKLAGSADVSSVINSGTGIKVAALSATWTCPADGLYYIGFVLVGGTPGSFVDGVSGVTGLTLTAASGGTVGAASVTGQTDLPVTHALTASGTSPWVGWY